MIFVTLCKGFLGIELHYELLRYFFTVTMSTRMKEVFPMGCTSIHLRRDRAIKYLAVDVT